MQTNSEVPKPKKPVITDVPSASPAAAAPKASAPKASPPAKFTPTEMIKLSLIEADPHNPRKDFPKEVMQELTASVVMYGVLEAITVRPVAGGKFRIIFGERRFRAAKAAGLDEIKAEVRNATDLEAADIQLEENLRRADLAPLEVAGGYQRQLELGRTMDQVCERSGKKRSAVYAMVQLLQLGDAGRKALGEQKISTSVAQLVARVPKSLQDKALSIVSGTTWQGPLAFREAEKQLGQVFTVDLRKAPWELKSEATPCVAKSCAVCPKRAGNAPELFPDIKNPDTCTDPVSYQQKLHLEMKKTVEAKGYKLLTPKEAPPDDLFYNNGAGALKQESGYVEPGDKCFEDTQNRTYGDLLTPEQKKKLIRVALDHNGKARQLLERAGLQREVKNGGIFKPRKVGKPSTRSTSSSSTTKSTESMHHRSPPPDLIDLVEPALIEAMVKKVEEKGFTPQLLKKLALDLVSSSYALRRRRCGHEHANVTGGKMLAKVIATAKPNVLAGIVFEGAYDGIFEDGYNTEEKAKDLFDIDSKKLELELKKANPILWSEDSKGATGSGVKNGAEYLIEKKGSSFVFVKPKDAAELKFDSLEKAKATAVKVETGLAVWKVSDEKKPAKKKK